MSTSVLVGTATRYRSTQEVAEAVAATLRECGLGIDIQPVREVRTLTGCMLPIGGAGNSGLHPVPCQPAAWVAWQTLIELRGNPSTASNCDRHGR